MGKTDNNVVMPQYIFGSVKYKDLPNLVSSKCTVTLSFFLAFQVFHLPLFSLVSFVNLVGLPLLIVRMRNIKRARTRKTCVLSSNSESAFCLGASPLPSLNLGIFICKL